MSGWFSDSVELDLRPGGRAVLHWHGQGSVDARVERVEPPRLFSFRWALGEAGWTLVEFSLAAEGDATRLTVVESGFADLAGADDDKQRHYDGHLRGWEIELGHLGEYVARRAGRGAPSRPTCG